MLSDFTLRPDVLRPTGLPATVEDMREDSMLFDLLWQRPGEPVVSEAPPWCFDHVFVALGGPGELCRRAGLALLMVCLSLVRATARQVKLPTNFWRHSICFEIFLILDLSVFLSTFPFFRDRSASWLDSRLRGRRTSRS